ncbi:hypothetical protein [Lysinibacillus sphaericus]|uniref:Uncharacterized protein n=1 Tax=Lysinibacillus sphaericus TaxID=1421 RepID=A0AAJ4ZUR6_LYSSH|nr:hypothetical protein [Lysinibacillus sphaericus]MED4542421.1 hypothetical protein [Lysinibacillus sphaericus]SUV16994.1 Uncharacterised protein [Lysinibacillus sphaericus]
MGGKLLLQAEATAIKMGAKKALLTTYDFQARTFDEARGYLVVGEIKIIRLEVAISRWLNS